MHELGLGDPKLNPMGLSTCFYGSEDSLKYPDVRAVGERRGCEAEVVDVGEGNASREVDVEGGDIDNKQQREYRRALRSAHMDWGKDPW